MSRKKVSVVFCTRDRPISLFAAVSKVLAGDVRGIADLVVVDDGDLGDAVNAICARAESRGLDVVYVKKAEDARGLYESRRAASCIGAGEIVLFLDDDAEIQPDYVHRLTAWFDDETIAGVGGVDMLGLPNGLGRVGSPYATFFMLSGPGPGALSPTGFNYSQGYWRRRVEPFAAEFLHGCNMAFRRSAISGLPEKKWLSGHSPCEDLVVSAHAAKSGRLVVDPGLAVAHVEAAGGRGDRAERLRAKVANQAMFQRERAGRLTPAFWWSVLGMFGKDVAKEIADTKLASLPDVGRGYVRGAWQAARV